MGWSHPSDGQQAAGAQGSVLHARNQTQSNTTQWHQDTVKCLHRPQLGRPADGRPGPRVGRTPGVSKKPQRMEVEGGGDRQWSKSQQAGRSRCHGEDEWQRRHSEQQPAAPENAKKQGQTHRDSQRACSKAIPRKRRTRGIFPRRQRQERKVWKK